jgi:hypothetical protein
MVNPIEGRGHPAMHELRGTLGERRVRKIHGGYWRPLADLRGVLWLQMTLAQLTANHLSSQMKPFSKAGEHALVSKLG